MTNKQAKSELMQIYGMLSEEKKKALDMAIKALEYDDAKYHEEHGEVVVDKAVWEDAKRALEQEPKADKVIKMRDATPEERESIDKYIKSISKPIGVDFWDLEQEPKTGQWKRRIVDGGHNADWKCSECGYKLYTDFVNYNFCPNCGCRMVEPQEISDHNLKMWEEIYAEEKRREGNEE